MLNLDCKIILPGVTVKSCYGINGHEVTNLAERETAILGIKPEKINKTGNVRSNVTLRGVPLTIVAVKEARIITYSKCASVT
jgi:hypothetical protein